MYPEVFQSQLAAEEFCRAAGGTLGVPATPTEQQEVASLLNATVLLNVSNTAAARPFSIADGHFAAWMGLNFSLHTFTWSTVGGGSMPSPALWAGAREGDTSCAVVLLKNKRAWASDSKAPDYHNVTAPLKLAWLPWACINGAEWDPLPALCRLPNATAARSLQEMAAEAPPTTGEPRSVVRITQSWQLLGCRLLAAVGL